MTTMTAQPHLSKSNLLPRKTLQGFAKRIRRFGRLWKRLLPALEFGRSARRPDRAFRRAGLLAAVRGNPDAAERLAAAARAIGGGL